MNESNPPRCPHCGEVIWERVPRLKRVYKLLKKRGRLTSRDLADKQGLSVQNANNQLRRLADLGVAQVADVAPNASGGYHKVYQPRKE